MSICAAAPWPPEAQLLPEGLPPTQVRSSEKLYLKSKSKTLKRSFLKQSVQTPTDQKNSVLQNCWTKTVLPHPTESSHQSNPKASQSSLLGPGSHGSQTLPSIPNSRLLSSGFLPYGLSELKSSRRFPCSPAAISPPLSTLCYLQPGQTTSHNSFIISLSCSVSALALIFDPRPRPGLRGSSLSSSV